MRYLRLNSPPPNLAAAAASAAPPPAALKLLIVDDSNIVRKTIERTLGGLYPLEVRMARDGVEALEAYREMRPDIVTLDITMPQMDGLTCLEEMRRFDHRARVLVISALADRATAVDALRRGAEAYLCKPFTSGELVEVFEELRAGDAADDDDGHGEPGACLNACRHDRA